MRCGGGYVLTRRVPEIAPHLFRMRMETPLRVVFLGGEEMMPSSWHSFVHGSRAGWPPAGRFVGAA